MLVRTVWQLLSDLCVNEGFCCVVRGLVAPAKVAMTHARRLGESATVAAPRNPLLARMINALSATVGAIVPAHRFQKLSCGARRGVCALVGRALGGDLVVLVFFATMLSAVSRLPPPAAALTRRRLVSAAIVAALASSVRWLDTSPELRCRPTIDAHRCLKESVDPLHIPNNSSHERRGHGHWVRPRSLPCYKGAAGADGQPALRCCQKLPPVYLRAHSTDALVMKSLLLHNGEFSPLVHPALCGMSAAGASALTPSRVRYIIDAGANCGMASVFLSTLFPDASVVAVEADEDNFLALKRNVRGRHVLPVHAALWGRMANISVQKHARVGNGGGEWAFSVSEAVTQQTGGEQTGGEALLLLPALTMDALMERVGFPRIDLLKLDVEGAELEIFTGATVERWLPKVGMVVTELHGWIPGAAAAVHATMRSYGASQRRMGEYTVFTLPWA